MPAGLTYEVCWCRQTLGLSRPHTQPNPGRGPVCLTMKSFSKPSMVAAMAAELGRDPRRCGPSAAVTGLLLRARLEACADRSCSISLCRASLSRPAPVLQVMLLRCVPSPASCLPSGQASRAILRMGAMLQCVLRSGLSVCSHHGRAPHLTLTLLGRQLPALAVQTGSPLVVAAGAAPAPVAAAAAALARPLSLAVVLAAAQMCWPHRQHTF